MRIGQSKDIHRLTTGRKLIIGGVEIPFEKGLLGHSDADVLLHAIIEAIIGAMGLRDIGTHFSDKDPAYEGVSSLYLLEKTYELMCAHGFHIGNIDSLIIIERPKMAPYIAMMTENVARVLHCDIERVNIKATCAEGMGFIGRGEGAMAEAVVLLEEDA